jgi:hypothetical protein
MTDALGSYPQFRLNFEQQGKRAKDLLKAARAGEAEALARFKSPPRLAEAQYLIARELRFDNWAAMKRHISEMTLAREAMHASAPDSDLPTLHIRCGHDLQESLKEAGFGGDYYVALGWQRQSRKDLFSDALGHRSASRAGRPSCARSRAQHGRRECSRFRAPRRRRTRR